MVSFGPSDTYRIALPASATYLDVQWIVADAFGADDFGVDDFRLETSAGRLVHPDEVPSDGTVLHVRIRGRGGAPTAGDDVAGDPLADQPRPSLRAVPERPMISAATALGPQEAADAGFLGVLLVRGTPSADPKTKRDKEIAGKALAIGRAIVRLFGEYAAFREFLLPHPPGPQPLRAVKDAILRHNLAPQAHFYSQLTAFGAVFSSFDESMFSLRVRANATPDPNAVVDPADRTVVSAADGGPWWETVTGQTAEIRPAYLRQQDVPAELRSDVEKLKMMVAPAKNVAAINSFSWAVVMCCGSYGAAFRLYRHVLATSTRSPAQACDRMYSLIQKTAVLRAEDTGPLRSVLNLIKGNKEHHSVLSLAFTKNPPADYVPPAPAPTISEAPMGAVQGFVYRCLTSVYPKVDEAAAKAAAKLLADRYGRVEGLEGTQAEEFVSRGWEAITSAYHRIYASWMINPAGIHPCLELVTFPEAPTFFQGNERTRLERVFRNEDTDFSRFLRLYHRYDDAARAVGSPDKPPDLNNPPSGHLPGPRTKIEIGQGGIAERKTTKLPGQPGAYSITSVPPQPPRKSDQRRLPSAKQARKNEERKQQADARMSTGETPVKGKSPAHPKPTPGAASPAAKRVAVEGQPQPAPGTPQRRVQMDVDRGATAAPAFTYPLGGHVPGLPIPSVRQILDTIPAAELATSFYRFATGSEPPEAIEVDSKPQHGRDRPHQRPALFEPRSPPAPGLWQLLSKGPWGDGAPGLGQPFEAAKRLLVSETKVNKLNEVVSFLPRGGNERRRAWCWIWHLRWKGEMLDYSDDFDPTSHLPYHQSPDADLRTLPIFQARSLRPLKVAVSPSDAAKPGRHALRPYGWRDFRTLRDLLFTFSALAADDEERRTVDRVAHVMMAQGIDLDAEQPASFVLRRPRTSFSEILQDLPVPGDVVALILSIADRGGIHCGIEFGGKVEVTHACHLCDSPLAGELVKNSRLAMPHEPEAALKLHNARNHYWVATDRSVADKIRLKVPDVFFNQNVEPWRKGLGHQGVELKEQDVIIGFGSMTEMMTAPIRAGYSVDWMRTNNWSILGTRVTTTFACKKGISPEARAFPALYDAEAWLRARQIAQSFGWFSDASESVDFGVVLDAPDVKPVSQAGRTIPDTAGAASTTQRQATPTEPAPLEEQQAPADLPPPSASAPATPERTARDTGGRGERGGPAPPSSGSECWTEDGACTVCGASKAPIAKNTRHRAFCSEKVRRFVNLQIRGGKDSKSHEAKITHTAHGKPVNSAVHDHLRHILVHAFEAETYAEKLRKELCLAVGMFQRRWSADETYVLDLSTVKRMATMVASRLQFETAKRLDTFRSGAGLESGDFAAERRATAEAMFKTVIEQFLPSLRKDDRKSYLPHLSGSVIDSVVRDLVKDAKRVVVWETAKNIRTLIRAKVQDARTADGAILFVPKAQNHISMRIWDCLWDSMILTAHQLELGAAFLLAKAKVGSRATDAGGAAGTTGSGAEATGASGRAGKRKKRRIPAEDKEDEVELEAEAAADQTEGDLAEPAAQAAAGTATGRRVFTDNQVVEAERIRSFVLERLGGEEKLAELRQQLEGVAKMMYLPVPPWPLRRVVIEHLIEEQAVSFFEEPGSRTPETIEQFKTLAVGGVSSGLGEAFGRRASLDDHRSGAPGDPTGKLPRRSEEFRGCAHRSKARNLGRLQATAVFIPRHAGGGAGLPRATSRGPRAGGPGPDRSALGSNEADEKGRGSRRRRGGGC
ncbi:hypothetical protein DFJ74DRAFT_253182 [Hyaloraphidium curvatum]|nr:hypothetical protein DFJ74DRAFT_253182 [Hyaloraphidium curvatum]